MAAGGLLSEGMWKAITAGAHPSATFRCWNGRTYEEAPWPAVVRDAEHMTVGLRRAGVRPGTNVACLLTNSAHTVRGLLGVWLAGGAVASLPIPSRGMTADEYTAQLLAICERLDSPVLLVDEEFLPALSDDLTRAQAVRAWQSFMETGKVEHSPPGDDDVAFIQYSSGSTSMPKGCMLTPRAIEAQIDLLNGLFQPVSPAHEVGYSWMPLSHDMGMFGGLLSTWLYGASFVMSTPQRFMFAPSTWLTEIAHFGATITGGPDTALRLAARSLRPQRLDGDFGRLRVCTIGAERVHADTLEFAIDKLAPYGFPAEALQPAYGMAEAVVAVTGTPTFEAPRHLVLDAIALADGEVEEVPVDHPSATRLVSAGPPGPGAELPGAPTDRVDEIKVRSRSLAIGYHGDPELTAERFRDGVLHTGDLGFVRDGYLYPVGRTDDLVTVAGRNVYTREIEAAVDELGDIREGGSAIVETGGRLALLMELKRPLEDYRGLAEQAGSIALSKAGVALDECVFLPKGSLPKTPSGKTQRHRCRFLLEAGRLEPHSVIDFAAA